MIAMRTVPTWAAVAMAQKIARNQSALVIESISHQTDDAGVTKGKREARRYPLTIAARQSVIEAQ
jgi:hypothetical protein